MILRIDITLTCWGPSKFNKWPSLRSGFASSRCSCTEVPQDEPWAQWQSRDLVKGSSFFGLFWSRHKGGGLPPLRWFQSYACAAMYFRSYTQPQREPCHDETILRILNFLGQPLVPLQLSIGLPFWPPTRGFGPVSKKTRSEEEGSHTIRPGVESWIFACIKCACGVWRSQCVGHLAWNKDVRTKEEDRTYHARLSSNPSLLVQWELQLDRTFFWYASGQKSHWRPKV